MQDNESKEKKIILYIWRFQPCHIGHIDALKQAFERKAQKIIIWIGSVNESWTEKNPRNAKIREDFLKAAIQESGLPQERMEFFRIPDFTEDEDRLMYIEEQAPEFTHVMSWNNHVLDIFTQAWRTVVRQEERIHINATLIRDALKRGDDNFVSEYVLPSVLDILQNRDNSNIVPENIK